MQLLASGAGGAGPVGVQFGRALPQPATAGGAACALLAAVLARGGLRAAGLQRNGLGADGALAVLGALRRSWRALRHLDLSKNALGSPAAAAALAGLLGALSLRLRALHLSAARLGSEVGGSRGAAHHSPVHGTRGLCKRTDPDRGAAD